MPSLFSLPVRVVFFLSILLVSMGAPVRQLYAIPTDTALPEVSRDAEASLIIWNRSIATFRTSYENITPKERVNIAAERIHLIPANLPDYNVFAADVIEAGQRVSLIKVNGRIMFVLLAKDVDTANGDTFELSKQRVVKAVRELLQARKSQYQLPLFLKAAGITLLATLILTFLAIGLSKGFRKVIGYLQRFESRLIKKFVIGNFNLAPYLVSFASGLVKLVEVISLVSLVYLWLTFVLSLFPFTEPWSMELSDFLVQMIYTLGRGMLVSLPGLFTIAVIFFISRLLVKAVSAFFMAVENSTVPLQWFEPETAKATRRIVVVLIWIFALIIAYPLIPGSETKAFQGVSVFLGLMVSLGSAGLVGQLIGGIMAVYTKSFQAGDFIKIGEHQGVVKELGMLAAKIVTIRKEEITIPNALLMSSTIVNYSRQSKEDGAMVTTGVTIGYDTPWRQVHALLLMGAERTKGIRRNPEPFILQKALSDFYVEYTLMFRIDRAEDRFYILSELHGHIQDAFNEHGVQIMSPNFVMQPDKEVYVPKEQWYAAPAKEGNVSG
jgi:small-conductance mechanosensitive channel